MGLQTAFVFVKPHANKYFVVEEVKKKFMQMEIGILKEGEMTGEAIDKYQYIDQHYYSIASKATLLQPKELNVPQDKFQKQFGIKWEDALRQGVVFNAMQACQKLGITADELDKKWAAAKKVGTPILSFLPPHLISMSPSWVRNSTI